MAENSKIEWTDHTFNPWIGCTRVSPGCVHCYAETLNNRRGWTQWGPRGERKRTSDWRKPVTWNRKAEAAGTRARVFCASLADVFDPHPSIAPEWRLELFTIMEGTPSLDWQVLTKRPENVMDMVPHHWTTGFPPNAWIGTSVEDQRRADERIPHLLRIPARVRFLSCEPLIGPVDFFRGPMDWGLLTGLHWVIIGGESGPGARPFNIKWAGEIVAQCRAAGVAPFVKQLGARPYDNECEIRLRDSKGGDMDEWPADLRIREMPA